MGEWHCWAVAVAEAEAGPRAGDLTALVQWTPAPDGGITSAREGCRGGHSCWPQHPRVPGVSVLACRGGGPRGAPGGPLRASALSEVPPKLRFLERSPRGFLAPSLV